MNIKPRHRGLVKKYIMAEMEEETLVDGDQSPKPLLQSIEQSTLVSNSNWDGDQLPQPSQNRNSETTPFSQKDIARVLEIVERDSMAIAESYTSLFSSLRLALSQVTSSSVEHMQCFNDAAGRVQESALDAATRGSRYINSCLRLNEEMKGIENLAMQLKMLRRSVDTLDSAVNKLTRLP